MNKYNHKKIEAKWQKYWQQKKIFQAKDFASKSKKYVLVEFPYPSGEGLHMGHLRPYVAADVYARFKRMQGEEVMFPMGWDAFGLPAENYAIKKGVHPSITTKKNIANAKKQMQSWGLSFDWSREINTTDPSYYKWTQWLFLQFYKAGLAYEATGLINWCPKDKTGLANEEVIDGKCERCGTAVEKKELRQWYLKITAYAEKLLQGLKTLDWPERVKVQQENWIGKSEGLEEYWQVDGMDIKLATFTTWPHTTWGATFMVIAPDHPIVEKLVAGTKFEKGAKEFAAKCAQEKIKDPLNIEKKKDGFFLGRYVINHLTGWKMPLYIANFAIMDYGTGIVKCTPTHDQRDFEFAKKYNLDFKLVIQPKGQVIKVEEMKEAYTDEGVMVNAGKFSGVDTFEARKAIADFTVQKGEGKYVTNYKLRDWVFSRQRYWGEPIPLIYCEHCANTKPKILVIHGLSGHANENWFPWFKEQMQAKGFEVLIPNLSNTEPPKLDEWIGELNRLGISKNDRLFIVGHSIGARTACHFIMQAKISVEKLILVAPTSQSQGEANWQNLRAAGVEDRFINSVKNFNKQKIHFDKLSKLVSSSTILLSDNDPYIPLSAADEYKQLAASIRVLKNRGHFNKKAGITSLPEILGEFPQNIDSGWVPVPDKDLPVKLPSVKNYQPTGTGESPLAEISKWVNVKCPVCKSPAKRETNTMPQWAGSSWYWLRYTDPKDKKEFASIEQQKYWTPVDLYFGGMEHTTLHLLYSRFWNLFLFDQGLVTSREPYKLRKPHGIVLASDGEKMSKSRGNVVNPDDIVKAQGADTLRMYELFLGPHEMSVSWNDQGVMGVRRFLDRVWGWVNQNQESRIKSQEESDQLQRALHKLIKKITEDLENQRFNTCVSGFMEFHNEIKDEPVSIESIKIFLKLLSPFAPHIVEELNQQISKSTNNQISSMQLEAWPKYDSKKVIDETVEIVVQVNGKVKGKVTIASGSSEDLVKQAAVGLPAVKAALADHDIKRAVFVPNRLINFVI